jgi:predicted nuclease of predicted toxin-antitoxin system
MRFLSDVGVSRSTAATLRQLGHEVLHLREDGLHRLADDQILELARREERIVLTFDLDFGDLLAAGGDSLPSVIIFRLHDQTPSSVTPKLLILLAEREQELIAGAIVIVEDRRYRLRRLPIRRRGGEE